MQDNRVFITSDQIIEIQVVGDQTIDSIHSMGQAVQRLSKKQRAKGLPVLIIDNVLRIGTVTPEARKQVAEWGKMLDFDKLAMVGSGSILRLGAHLMLRAVDKRDQLKYFESYQTAADWLQT